MGYQATDLLHGDTNTAIVSGLAEARKALDGRVSDKKRQLFAEVIAFSLQCPFLSDKGPVPVFSAWLVPAILTLRRVSNVRFCNRSYRR